MRIQSAELRQSSINEKLTAWSRTETLKVVNAPRRFAPPNLISAQSASRTAARVEESIEDLKFRLLKRMLEALTGKSVETVRSLRPEPPVALPAIQAVASAPQAQGAPVVEMAVSERYYEAEALSYRAQGVVKTADGKEITIDLELNMNREFFQETNLRFVNGKQVTDPLVVNFEGPAAALTGEKFSFDLDSDGSSETISRLASSSGYLALDKNGDGTVNDGSELFGPSTGLGFRELAVYDADKNGWIDEADPVYGRLKIWVDGGAQGGGTLLALAQVGVGAISLQNLRTPFDIKDTATNELMGSVRSSSVFLREEGGAGTVQQLDLAV